MQIFIYTLTDPTTNLIRYVGKTKSIKRRYAQHLSENSKTHKCNWIKSLKVKGIKPIIQIIDICDNKEDSIWIEQYWISQFKTWGFNLTNLTEGGEGQYGRKLIFTQEHINKIKKAACKKVYQYDLNNNLIYIFNSLKECVLKYGNAIIRCVINERKTAYNYIWKYNSSYEKNKRDISIEERKKRSNRMKEINNNKKIKVYDKKGILLDEFDSIKDAVLKYNINYTAISNNLQKRSKYCNNKKFEYA